MLINSGAAIIMMSYVIFKKLEQEDDEFVKTNLTLNGVGGNSMEARGVVSMELTMGASCSLPRSSSSRCKVIVVLFLATIRFTPTAAFILLWINS
jgi:hypothetical protein